METVTSADGTTIAYDRTGDGPVLIVSVGAFCTRHTFVPAAELTRRFTVITYDRRRRGDSGDTIPFAPEREYEDLAAVAAVTATEPPFVSGHSSGAAIALLAAARGLPAAGAAAYEATFTNDEALRRVPRRPTAYVSWSPRAAGRERDAVIFWMTDVVHMPDEATAGLADAPWVTDLEPLARTLPYDIAVTAGRLPADELAKIDIPVLVMGGGNSSAWFRRSIGVAGNSAGGGLAAATALMARDQGGPELCMQYLSIPELDDRLETPSTRAFTDTPVANRANPTLTWQHYLAGQPATAYAAPARAADLTGLPPSYVAVCEFDPLRDEGIEYAQRLVQAGVPVELHLYPGTFHGSSRITSAAVSQRMSRDSLEARHRLLRA